MSRFAIFNTSNDRCVVLQDAPSFRDAVQAWLESPNCAMSDYMNFTNASLGGLSFYNKASYRSYWNSADLECVLFKDCSFGGSRWTNTRLDGAKFVNTYLRDASFRDCDLSLTTFEGCDLYNCNFRNCTFGPSFDYDRAIRAGATFSGCTGLAIPPKEWEIDGI